MRDQLSGRLTCWPRGSRLEGKTLPDGLTLSLKQVIKQNLSPELACVQSEREKRDMCTSAFSVGRFDLRCNCGTHKIPPQQNSELEAAHPADLVGLLQLYAT
jgi:hypothetical protein